LIATTIVEGTKTASSVLRILYRTEIPLITSLPRALAMISETPANRKGVVSLSEILRNPTINPIRISADIQVELTIPSAPRTIARTTPIRKAHRPTVFIDLEAMYTYPLSFVNYHR
jgi:hypothetical protein